MVIRHCFRHAGAFTFLAVAAMACDAHAGWHHRYAAAYGSAGSSGGSSGGSYGSSGGSYGSHGSYGSIGGHFAAKRAWRAYRHSLSHGSYGSGGGSSGGSSGGSYGGSSGGSYGGSSGGGSSGGSYGGSSSASYGSYGSYGGYGPSPAYTSGYSSYPSGSVIGGEQIISEGAVYGSPVYEGSSAIENVPASAPIIDSSSVEPAVPADGAMLVVRLPADAEVFVNGAKTSATGVVRRYMSRGLEKGREYDFVVKVVTKRDGEPREETKVAALSAGRREQLDFTAPVAAKASRKTSLTLRVPAGAKVWLAGNETVSEGETRVFETSQLGEGQAWRNYEIRVATVIDGREQIASKTIDLIGGSTVELAIDPAQRTAAAEATAAIR